MGKLVSILSLILVSSSFTSYANEVAAAELNGVETSSLISEYQSRKLESHEEYLERERKIEQRRQALKESITLEAIKRLKLEGREVPADRPEYVVVGKDTVYLRTITNEICRVYMPGEHTLIKCESERQSD
jgi:hypothetical protein